MQNAIGNLFKMFLPRSDSVIGVDAGSAYLKVVQLRRKSGKAVLETYGSLALGPYASLEVGRATRLPPDKLSEALRDIMREARVTGTRAGIAIPLSSSLVMPIEMPALSEKELAAAVPIEARKYVPVPISEVNLDWWLLPEEPERLIMQAGPPEMKESERSVASPKKLPILIAAIHNDALVRFESVAVNAGLSAVLYEIELFSVLRALFPDDLAMIHAVLDLGASETKLYIMERGLLRFSHVINRGAQDLTLMLSHASGISMSEAEKIKRKRGLENATEGTFHTILDSIFSEVMTSLRAFERRFGHRVEDLTLTGGGANLLGIEEFVLRVCNISARRANPFSRVEAPAFLDETFQAIGPEFSVAIGVAFKKMQELG